MRTLVAAVAVVLAFGLTGCKPKDEPADRVGPPADDLAPNGGVICPRVLPTAPDDEYGFGTDEPATTRPDPGDFTRAWVCTYGLADGDPTWVSFEDEEVPVAEADLADLNQALEGLVPAAGDRSCTDDLGPRYLVVTLRGGSDLTGYAVDDFGCLEVRMTDDPSTNPVGEARQPGTVRGVLDGGRALRVFALRYVEGPG